MDEWDFATTISIPSKCQLYFNGVGSMQPLQGIMGKLMTPEKFELRGKSCIIDAKGQMMGAWIASRESLSGRLLLESCPMKKRSFQIMTVGSSRFPLGSEIDHPA